MTIKGLMVDPITNMPIIILRDKDGQRVLPIWVGVFEANAIALQIENVATPRPMTHDLLKNVIGGQYLGDEDLGGSLPGSIFAPGLSGAPPARCLACAGTQISSAAIAMPMTRTVTPLPCGKSHASSRPMQSAFIAPAINLPRHGRLNAVGSMLFQGRFPLTHARSWE